MKRIIRERQLPYDEWEKDVELLLRRKGQNLRQVLTQGLTLYPLTDFYERGFTPKQAVEFIMVEIDRNEYQ